MSTELEAALQRLNAVTFAAAIVKDADKKARAELAKLMHKGDTLAVRSSLTDERMSRVTMSDPDAVAEVDDPSALDEWIRENYPDKIATHETIIGTEAEVRAVLREHASHLLATHSVVPGWAVNELVTLSAGARQPVGFGGEMGDDAPPGITVRKPDGRLSITVDRERGMAEFRKLWDAGVYELDGTVVRMPEVQA